MLPFLDYFLFDDDESFDNDDSFRLNVLIDSGIANGCGTDTNGNTDTNTDELLSFRSYSFGDNESLGEGDDSEDGVGADSNDNVAGSISGVSINADTNCDGWNLLLPFRSFNNNDWLNGGNNTERGISIDTAFLDADADSDADANVDSNDNSCSFDKNVNAVSLPMIMLPDIQSTPPVHLKRYVPLFFHFRSMVMNHLPYAPYRNNHSMVAIAMKVVQVPVSVPIPIPIPMVDYTIVSIHTLSVHHRARTYRMNWQYKYYMWI